MQYKFVWADGILELASGFAKGVHHYMLLEKIEEELGHVPESYCGGTFSEDNFGSGQFDVCRITWQGQGNSPTADQIRFLIQHKLNRYADREAMIIDRVDEMCVTAAIENELKQVAEKHKPEGGYGDTCWNPETKTVLWVPADWTSNEEAEAARKDFMAIDGVEAIEGDAEQGLPYMMEDSIRTKKPLQLKKPWRRIAADVEDTEPEYNFSFLKNPHKELYPPAFDGGKKITPRATKLLKGHVLDALKEGGYSDADSWIYFTVYGSGISYNWDESGDFDVQMWVDVNKYNSLHADAPQTSDDLVAAVRRIVQSVNFPSFKEIGLDAPGKEDATGSMLIQYYPKPGEGTKEENLASQPYSCYDLETSKWLQRPQPLTPEFYGEHFLSVMQKAEDIAVQAEAILEELQRNTISWQFWKQMIDERNDPKYVQAMETARTNAEQEKEGVKKLFDGVFGGRAEAYSPEGKGINDERDIIQKLLEVWGVFQRLKHFARQELPWEEQEMPEPKESKQTELRPHPHLTQVAHDYMNKAGLPYNPPTQYVQVNPDTAAQIAYDYEEAPNDPQHPDVAASYDAMKRETAAQYEHLLKHGYQMEFYPDTHDPYPTSPHEAVRDIYDNKHLYVYPTQAGFGSDDRLDASQHPLLENSDYQWNGKPVSYNDLFRGVHDVFGHAKNGVGFRADGEENAWNQHSAMYSEQARPALTAETRGQNSWVNFGPYGEHNRNAGQGDTWYADQKATILPQWTSKLRKFADWSEIMQNAQWLRQNNMVQITNNGATHVEGTVGSQESPGVTYNTSFDRVDPNSSAITTWNCTCPWGAVSWGRTRQWKKYEGRPCKHTLAMYWQSLSQPLDEDRPEAQGQQQLFNPQSLMPPQSPGGANQPPPTPLGTPPSAQPPTAPAPTPTPAMSNPTPAQPAGPGSPSVAIPGAFSKVHQSNRKLEDRQSVFQNGQVVVLKIPSWGIDRDQNQTMVPVGALGEVLWSDDQESIVIFPLDSGILEPHLVRVQTETSNLRPSRAKTPFVRKR